MKQYKTGDKVRTSDDKDAKYENCKERIYLFEADGLVHCVCPSYNEDFKDPELAYQASRWHHIIEKPPAEYTLKGKDIEIMAKFISKLAVGIPVNDYRRVLEIEKELNEATK